MQTRYEIYGGGTYFQGRAGQQLPDRYNLGGFDFLATYWASPRIGLAGGMRYGRGSTNVVVSPQSPSSSATISQFIGLGGIRYRLISRGRVSLGIHALGGFGAADYQHSNPGIPADTYSAATGLYKNGNSPIGIAGGDFEFRRNGRFGLRVAPEAFIESFGTDTRSFFSLSTGIFYRFGHR